MGGDGRYRFGGGGTRLGITVGTAMLVLLAGCTGVPSPVTTDEPTATATPSPTATATATLSPTATGDGSGAETPTRTRQPTPTRTATVTPTSTPRPTDTRTATTEPSGTPTPRDADADGYTAEEDCNDNDETVHPGAEEVRDGKDNDCDGMVDEGTTPTPTPTPRDADGDGYAAGEDCDDNDETVYPGAPEQRDGKDNDCDGMVDEGTTPTPTPTPRDADGDGYAAGEDCDDNDETVHPGAEEVRDGKDNDCDGMVDEGTTPTPTP